MSGACQEPSPDILLDWGGEGREDGGMGRPRRIQVGGLVYHVFNCANGRAQIFTNDGDYEAFSTPFVRECLPRGAAI